AAVVSSCIQGVGVHASLDVLDLLDRAHDGGLTRDVSLYRFPSDLLTNGLSTITVEISNHNRLRMVHHESPRERSTDAASGSSHDYHLVGQLHRDLIDVAT